MKVLARGNPVVISEKVWPRLWESAYRRFETPEEETFKFVPRLLNLGGRDWPRGSAITELLFVGTPRSHPL